MDMVRVEPFVQCIDCWPGRIPKEKLAAYKQLIAEGMILKPHVLYSRKTGRTFVRYEAIAPHEWILEEMKRRVENGEKHC